MSFVCVADVKIAIYIYKAQAVAENIECVEKIKTSGIAHLCIFGLHRLLQLIISLGKLPIQIFHLHESG